MPGKPSLYRRLLSAHAGRGLLLLLFLSCSAGCLGQPIPLEKYQADLRKCLEYVQQAKANPGAAAANLRQARRILPMRWQVMRGAEASGEIVTVPADKLLQELYAAETADKDVASKLSDVEEELAWALEESSQDARAWHTGKEDVARKQLAEILARSEFRRAARETLMDRLRRWINYWIGRALLALLPGAFKHGKWVGHFLWGTILLGALLVLYRFLRPYVGRKQREAGARRGGPTGPADASAARRTAQQWMVEAWEQIEAGDYRRAIRAAYHAGLEYLIAKDLLDYHFARTNREYLSFLRASAELYGKFSRLTDQFERVWYGRRSCARPEAEAFLAGIRALEAPVA